MTEDKKDSGPDPNSVWRIWGAVVVVAWIVTFVCSLILHDDGGGTFGDTFGSINALFSGLAFVGLVYAILLQRQELALQRQELASTRNELRGQKEAQLAQNRFVAQQLFESTFFQMLRELNEILDAIDFRVDGTETARGRDAIAVLYKRLDREVVRQREKANGRSFAQIAKDAFDIFYDNHGNEFGHYFRLMYNILKYIDNSGSDNKMFYAHILRSQLSNIECNLLFYDSISTPGAKILKYVNRYHLLKHCDEQRLFGETPKALHVSAAFEDD